MICVVCAHNQGCYDELMEIRDHVLEYLKTLKEVTHHTNADESDEIETAKLNVLKEWGKEFKEVTQQLFLHNERI